MEADQRQRLAQYQTTSDWTRAETTIFAKIAEKSAKNPNFVKKPKPVSAPKPTKQPKKQQATLKSIKQTKQQPVQPQTQKPQVLHKVFSNTAKSNLVAPQTPATSTSSLLAQNAAKSRSELKQHDPNSVANIQRQLYPLANNDVVKRLTSE